MAEYAEAEKKKVKRENRTNIPDGIKERIERTSGVSLDDVRVHYDSDRPGLVGALAFTQGNQVYMGAAQEKYLPHELGHVVQQKMGMVRPTRYENGYAINDDSRLERQADAIGMGHVSFGENTGKTKEAGEAIQMASATLTGKVQGEEISVTGESAGGAGERAAAYSFTCAPIDGKFQAFSPYSYVDVNNLYDAIRGIGGKKAKSKEVLIRQAMVDLAGMKRRSKNVWEGTGAYERCEGYANDLGINFPEKSRNQYYCAEPHALKEIMPLYQEKRKNFLERIQEKIKLDEGEDVYAERKQAVEDASYGQEREKGALIHFLKTLRFSNVNHDGELLPPCPVCRQWVYGLGDGEAELRNDFKRL